MALRQAELQARHVQLSEHGGQRGYVFCECQEPCGEVDDWVVSAGLARKTARLPNRLILAKAEAGGGPQVR